MWINSSASLAMLSYSRVRFGGGNSSRWFQVYSSCSVRSRITKSFFCSSLIFVSPVAVSQDGTPALRKAPVRILRFELRPDRIEGVPAPAHLDDQPVALGPLGLLVEPGRRGLGLDLGLLLAGLLLVGGLGPR